MAISLITEVMDHAPRTLTHREHKVLMILAEDASPGSRVIWQSLDSPQLHYRARLSRGQFYAVIAELVAKKCLKRLTPGGGGHVAKYQIPVLAPSACVPENVTQVCVPETGTQSGSVSRKPGHSVSRKPGRLLFNGAPVQGQGQDRAASSRSTSRRSAANSENHRVHDGPEDPTSDAQQSPIPVTRQSQAADRNARDHTAPLSFQAAAANRARERDKLTARMSRTTPA